MTEQKQDYQRVKIGGLWENTTKNGIKYLSGDLSFASSIQIWPNKKRDGMNDPDFTMFITEKKKIANQSKIGAMELGKNVSPTFDFKDLPKSGPEDLSDIPF